MTDLAQKLKRLNEAARELATAKDERELLERMLDVIEQVFGRKTAAILFREAGGTHLSIVAARGYEPSVVERYRAPVGKGVVGRVAASGEPRLVRDVRQEPDYVPGVSEATSEMAVPLVVDGEVIGVLDVESREQAFGETDMALLVAFGDQAGWAMRHGRALEQAADRARRLELLNRAARALNSVHDPDQLLGRILELAHEALGLNNVAVLVADDDRENLVVRKALRATGIDGMTIPAGQGVTGTVFQSGRGEIVPDVAADPRYIAGGARGTRSEMVAPLNLNGEIIGVLDAEGEAIESFDELDLEVFNAFAAQVATALRNAELVQRLQDRARRLQEVAKTASAINTVHDTGEVLRAILRGASRALGLQRSAILLADTKTGELCIRAARGYGDVVGTRIAFGTGVTGSVAASGEPALVAEVSEDDRYLPGVAGGASEMAAPLIVRGELLGVLDTESTEPGAFSLRDLELFQAFADQAAVALYNARLFRRLDEANERLKSNVEEMGRLNRELETYSDQISAANQSLEQQIRQLTTLHQAGQTITSSLDLQQTLDAILSMSAEIVSSSSGAIKLLDDETKELRVAAQAGVDLDANDGLLRYDLPLRIGERTIGVFELCRMADEQLGEDERQLLETLASQAAIAIENARLFEDTQRVYYETLKSLARALEARDHYTRGHSERVAELSLAVAERMELDEDRCHLIHNAALLHDIGKIGVRDAVLLAPRKLTDKEMAVIRQHPTFGNVILGPLKFLGAVSDLVKHHHERWDGTGYPDGICGDAIPLESRIIAVADAFDAMTTSRPYRGARTHSDALAEIQREAGRQFDPAVVSSFVEVVGSRPALDSA
ncbi:MAG: GAF domain-containing protein [Deltaproteobacteria bacterium]|jgi:putative nucleotidyltransferase with HDIG domain|nr:GAF domain-containing protein [Deltaproteobacteria bacterium]MBW2537047.1 GAF domain-containing protein [Deltaproteobacteria bacterium]